MMNAENKRMLDHSQRDKVEPEEYVRERNKILGEHLEQFDT